MIKAGTRYITPSGAELVVTKGGDGMLTDGEVPAAGEGFEQRIRWSGDQRGRDDHQPWQALPVR